MPAKVILKAVIGQCNKSPIVLDDKTQCIIGRASDCSLQVTGLFNMVSRHHCLLAIDLPAIRVRDLGSLNGTYVNDHLIGQRARDSRSEADTSMNSPDHLLQPGDRLQVGDVIFDVCIKK